MRLRRRRWLPRSRLRLLPKKRRSADRRWLRRDGYPSSLNLLRWRVVGWPRTNCRRSTSRSEGYPSLLSRPVAPLLCNAAVGAGFARLAGCVGSALGALLGHACSSGEVGWGGTGLADDVEVAVLAAGPVAYIEDRFRAHCHRLRRPRQLLLLASVAFALPGYEDAVWLQERGCELGYGREAAYS